jgi:hypothetical protein
MHVAVSAHPSNIGAAPAGARWSVRRIGAGASLAAGAGLVATSAGIHLHLWAAGYRHIPTIGSLFLLQGIGGIALALLVVAWRRPIVILAGAGFLAATIGGFLLSLWVGLFGFRDTFAAPLATASLVVEIAGAAVLVVAAVLVRSARKHRFSIPSPA